MLCADHNCGNFIKFYLRRTEKLKQVKLNEKEKKAPNEEEENENFTLHLRMLFVESEIIALYFIIGFGLSSLTHFY